MSSGLSLNACSAIRISIKQFLNIEMFGSNDEIRLVSLELSLLFR